MWPWLGSCTLAAWEPRGAPGHRWTLPARGSPDVSAQLVTASPSRRDGDQLERLVCIRLPGSCAAARGDLLLGFQKQQNLR